MLTLADRNGEVSGSVGGLAHVANVSREECEAALTLFMAADLDSRTPDNEGRRIEKSDGGWRVLNAEKYRDMRSETQVEWAKKKREWREAKGQSEDNADTSETNETRQTALASASSLASNTALTTPEPSGSAKLKNSFNLAPYIDEHRELFPDSDPPTARYGKVFKRLEAKHGAPETLRRWRMCLDQKRDFATPEELSSHWSKYDAPGTSNLNGKGSTTRAMKLIGLIRQRRSPMFPNNVVPEWQEGLTPAEVQVCKTVGITRILNDANEGTMVAQITRALEESA